MLYLAVAALLLTNTPDDEAPIIEDDSAEGEFGLPSFETAPDTVDETEEEPGAPARKKHHKKKPRRKRVVPEYRGVGLLSLGAGIGASASGVQFDADLFGSGGVMFRPGIAIVGLANVQIMPSAMGVTQRYGLGAGVRFGRHTHLTLGATANVLYTRRYGAEFAGTAIVQVFGLIKSRFGFVLTPAFTWSEHMVLFSVTLGLGVNF
jgi:hypothetical protein